MYWTKSDTWMLSATADCWHGVFHQFSFLCICGRIT